MQGQAENAKPENGPAAACGCLPARAKREPGPLPGVRRMHKLFGAIDLPPIWLFGHLVVAWGIGRIYPVVLAAGAGRWIGGALVLAGLGLLTAAIRRMAARKTTVIPRRAPAALVTDGAFGFSRNPIYLADALILTGAIFWWDALLALPLVAVFVGVIQTRFIRDEEAVLTAAFGPEFDLWAQRVRRWVGRR